MQDLLGEARQRRRMPGQGSAPSLPAPCTSSPAEGFRALLAAHLDISAGQGEEGQEGLSGGRLPGHRPAALQRDAGGRVARLTGERQRLTAFLKLFFVLATQSLEAIGAVPLEEPLRNSHSAPPPRWLFRPQGRGALFVQALGV